MGWRHIGFQFLLDPARLDPLNLERLNSLEWRVGHILLYLPIHKDDRQTIGPDDQDTQHGKLQRRSQSIVVVTHSEGARVSCSST